jgi:hypothetical protein
VKREPTNRIKLEKKKKKKKKKKSNNNNLGENKAYLEMHIHNTKEMLKFSTQRDPTQIFIRAI